MRRHPTIRVDRAERQQPPARLLHPRLGRRIEPAERARIGDAPARAIEHQRREIGLQDFGRIEARQAGGRGFLPQPVGDPRPLSRRAPRALRGGGLAHPLGHQPRHPGRAIIARAAGEA